MSKNHVTAELVTLDAARPHPGLDPFRPSKVRREARNVIAALDLTLAEQMAVSLIINRCDPRIVLPAPLVALAELARDGK